MNKGLAWPLLEKLGGSCPREAAIEGSHPARGGDRAPCAPPAWGGMWQGGIEEPLGIECHRAGCCKVMTQNLCNAPVQLLLQMNPYHVDSLLQLSDVCRMQEDQEMARDLIGKSEVRSRCVGVKPFPGKGNGGQELGFSWTNLNPRVVPFPTQSGSAHCPGACCHHIV